MRIRISAIINRKSAIMNRKRQQVKRHNIQLFVGTVDDGRVRT